MFVGGRINQTSIPISMTGNLELEIVKTFKYLSTFLDESLSFCDLVDYVYKRACFFLLRKLNILMLVSIFSHCSLVIRVGSKYTFWDQIQIHCFLRFQFKYKFPIQIQITAILYSKTLPFLKFNLNMIQIPGPCSHYSSSVS